MSGSTPTPNPPSRTWLSRWEPENDAFWAETGKRLAWRTLTITTCCLTMGFITWFVVSALVVRLPAVGFRLTTGQLFWLTAMPGLSGGSLRLVCMFFTPIFGTRAVVGWGTLSLLVPLIGWFFAAQDPDTPYWLLLLLAFLAGLGGGIFSAFMPSTSLFFPKRLQGTALAIQAGVGNFGVSVVQFVTPWIIGFALLGTLGGDPLTFTRPGGVTSPIWLQNATAVYVPFVAVFSIVALIMLRSLPVRASFAEQFDIFRSKHTWIMTSLYVMTLGGFTGFSATFPLLIRTIFGGLPGAPDPLAWAFYGPLVGSLVRIMAGPFTDKYGGAIVTHIAGVGMTVCAIAVTFFTGRDMANFPVFVALMLGLFFFAGIGNASTFKQMPMLFPPRQGGGVLGFTAAIAAYGPFGFGVLFGWSFGATQSPNAVFYGAAAFFAANVAMNWWLYTRRNAPHPC